MSIRSLIAVKNEDGSIESVYCHSDGYPDHNGKLLLENYNSEEKARQIVALGWLSFLDTKLAPEKEFDKPRYDWIMKEDVKHTFDSPQDGVTTAYHRDRNEELRIDKFANEGEWLKCDLWADYKYLWKDGKWFVDSIELTSEIIENGMPEES